MIMLITVVVGGISDVDNDDDDDDVTSCITHRVYEKRCENTSNPGSNIGACIAQAPGEKG